MATLTPTLTLESTDATSDALSLSVTDSLTIVSPLVNISKITATTTGGDSIIVPNLDSPKIGEFAFFPFYAGAAGKLQLQASANTVQVEYAYFTRG